MNLKNLVQSKNYKIVAISLAAMAVMFLTFVVGMHVGFRKAMFSYQWGENYHKNFTGPRGGMFRGMLRDFGGKDFIDSHGASGQILKVDPSTDSTGSLQAGSGQAELIIKGQDGVEKIIVIKEDTSIARLRETIKISDLKINDSVAIIGSPNEQGQIEAKFIRVLPEPGAIAPFKGIK
ncbi:MAG: hypothetical protein Q7K16_04350 [Candidatus Azambacteria bacterium]|nr:hypothetical protein [Candidatus Azambacteria bacterium]